jgi:hypothetical protein
MPSYEEAPMKGNRASAELNLLAALSDSLVLFKCRGATTGRCG